jgi:hypothetical protein
MECYSLLLPPPPPPPRERRSALDCFREVFLCGACCIPSPPRSCPHDDANDDNDACELEILGFPGEMDGDVIRYLLYSTDKSDCWRVLCLSCYTTSTLRLSILAIQISKRIRVWIDVKAGPEQFKLV